MMQQIFRVVLFGICCLFLISGGASAAITPDPMIQADLKNLFTNAPQVQGIVFRPQSKEPQGSAWAYAGDAVNRVRLRSQ
jgi:hypothetical protein